LIVEFIRSKFSIKNLELYAEAFRTIEIYDQLAFLHLNNVNVSLLGAAEDIVISVFGGGHNNMAGGFISLEVVHQKTFKNTIFFFKKHVNKCIFMCYIF